MRYNIEGFDQTELIKLDINISDIMILRYIVDLEKSERIVRKEIDGVQYFWVKYSAIIENLPVLGIKNKVVVARHINKLVKAGLLKKITLKQDGTFTMFSLTVKLISIDRYTETNNGLNPKVKPKDSAIKDSAIKNSTGAAGSEKRKTSLTNPSFQKFELITNKLSQSNLSFTNNRESIFKKAERTLTFEKIVAAVDNLLADINAPPSHKNFDWLFNKFEFEERIDRYYSSGNNGKTTKYNFANTA